MEESEGLRPIDDFFNKIYEDKDDDGYKLRWIIAIKEIVLINISGYLKEMTNSFFNIIEKYHFNNEISDMYLIQDHIKVIYERGDVDDFQIIKDILYLYCQYYTDFYNERMMHRRELYVYWIIDNVQHLSDYSFEKTKSILENVFSVKE